MKECCKTGDEEAPSAFKKITKLIVWGIVILIIISLTIIQIFNL